MHKVRKIAGVTLQAQVSPARRLLILVENPWQKYSTNPGGSGGENIRMKRRTSLVPLSCLHRLNRSTACRTCHPPKEMGIFRGTREPIVRVATLSGYPRMAIAMLLLLNLLGVAPAFENPAHPAEAFVPGKLRQWSGSDFLRVRKDAEGIPRALETAIVRFEGVPGAGSGVQGVTHAVTVDLVAAVHVADPAYYRALNEHFKRYEAVLYELVAPPDARFAPGEAPWDFSLLGIGQRLSAGVLGLQYQLDGINYKAENFVHADMTPEQFERSMRRRGENSWQILSRVFTEVMRDEKPPEPSLAELRDALRQQGKARQLALKRWAAQQMMNSEFTIRVVEGPRGSTVLSGRNKVAIAVLRREVEEQKRHLAIFYGAAHMPDLATRLQDEWGLRAQNRTWLVAWDLTE